MRIPALLAVVVGGALTAPAIAADTRSEEREAFFEARIRPVLATTCVKCHSSKKMSNGLRLDQRKALITGGDSGPTIVPGHPEKSLLLRALRYQDDDLKMPPDKKLPDAVIADFERWIREGAVWPARAEWPTTSPTKQPSHWAFQPVRKVNPPPDPTGWSNNPVDSFIHAGLASHGLSPTVPADKRTLLRRTYFDLVGLPPTPLQLEDFLADRSPQALSNVVESLLASPQYGERWGRYWMDVVRYADTAGDNADYPVPEARLYRDYIIDSFNADKPYDEFIREQIAGDILAKGGPADKYAERVIATGFLALSRRYATAPYELWHLTLEDTIDTVGRGFLGITLRCARCHDHKFDPVPTRDYYRLYGIFASTEFPYAGSEEFVSMKFGRRAFASLVPLKQTSPLMSAYQSEIAKMRGEIARMGKSRLKGKAAKSKLHSLEVRLKVLERRGAPEALPVAYAVNEGKITDACIQLGGEPGRPGANVPRGAPQFLAEIQAPPPGANESGRLELADWLASPRNPLTARVIVNRVWQHHFGKGIVETPSNFGTRGSPPSHPGLLDWLTASFIEHGWSIKFLHRLILESKTYQLGETADAASEAVDSTNRWHWRFTRQRLDAEAIRDAMLYVGGTLDVGRPGPHPFPAIRDWIWTQHNPFHASYPSTHRSVYLMTQRLHRHPFLGLFDGPDTNTTTDVRSNSTVPLQALYLMNSDTMRKKAGAFATRLCRESNDPATRIHRAHELAYSRPASPAELDRGYAYVEQYSQEARKAGLEPHRAAAEAWLSYARTILNANEFVYID